MLAAFLALAAHSQNSPADQIFRLGIDDRDGHLMEAPDLDGDGVRDISWTTGGGGAPGLVSGTIRTYSSRTQALLQEVQSTAIWWTEDQQFGLTRSVAWIGDANGDGHPDLLGTRSGNYMPLTVIDGITGADIFQVTSTNVSPGYPAFGALGDMDGDGEDDIWTLTRPGNGLNDKTIEIYSSATGTLIRSLPLQGSHLVGRLISAYPDADGDGLDDILVGDVTDITTSRGVIISSVTGAELVEFLDIDPGSRIDQGLRVIGDVNRDGAADVFAWKIRGSANDGAIVFSGATGEALYAVEGPPSPGFTFGRLGQYAADIGDIDGDRHDDFVVADAANRLVQVRSGASGRVLWSLEGPQFTGFGRGVLGPGDIDGDGTDDWVAAFPDDPFDPQQSFAAYAYRWNDSGTDIQFEQEENGGVTIVNGKALDQESPLTQPLRILSGSYGTFEVAAFDTSPTGPNAGGPGAELLVDSGNVVILQESQAQTVTGTFDQAAPAALGGDFDIVFRDLNEPLSIDLIHVPVGQSMEVVTTDRNGLTRTFTVPGGFTSTASLDPEATRWTLNLDTLQDQEGFAATATAMEDVGFRQTDVRSIKVRMTGMSAVDRLRIDDLVPPSAGTLTELASPAGAGDVRLALGLADITGDGRTDVVTATEGASGTAGSVIAYSSSGQSALYVIPGIEGETLLQIGDITDDGAGDLAIGWADWDDGNGYSPGELRLHDGASGALIERLEGFVDGERFGAGATALNDVDGDGIRDLAASFPRATGSGSRVRVYSSGSGAVLMDRTFDAPCTPLAGLFAFTDQDADGIDELLIHASEVGCSTMLISPVTGATIASMPPNEFESRAFVPGDMDGDRRDDIVRLERESDLLVRYRGYSGTTYAPLFDRGVSTPGGADVTIGTMGDLNRDGRSDFALIYPSNLFSLRLFGLDSDLWTVCSGAPYGGGQGGRLRTIGSPSIAANDLTLEAWNLPNTAFALLLNASATVPTSGAGSIPLFSDGNLCLSPASLARHPVIFPVIDGVSSMPVNLMALPTAGAPGFIAPAQAGETRFWQCWFRDPGGFLGSNLSDAVGVTFTQ